MGVNSEEKQGKNPDAVVGDKVWLNIQCFNIKRRLSKSGRGDHGSASILITKQLANHTAGCSIHADWSLSPGRDVAGVTYSDLQSLVAPSD
jgi:hypothetical protein